MTFWIIAEGVVIVLLIAALFLMYKHIDESELKLWNQITKRKTDNDETISKNIADRFTAVDNRTDMLATALNNHIHEVDDYMNSMKAWGDDVANHIAKHEIAIDQKDHDHYLLLKTAQELGELTQEMHQPYFGDEVLDPDEIDFNKKPVPIDEDTPTLSENQDAALKKLEELNNATKI